MSIIKYRPEIDGLRAVAVIPVVLFHLGATWIPGGFVGVDVFFVISGFLITSIILKEQTAGTFTFSSFWMRRVRRILPAMLTMLMVTSVAGYFLLFGPSWRGLGDQVISAIALYANIEMWQLSGSYWGPAAESAPLLHTWSLSVEEQFYLFYPLLLLLLLKFTPKRVFSIILSGCLLSFTIGVYATTNHPSAAFYLLPARAWELAAGCLLAIFERSRGPAPQVNISRTLAFAGLLLVGAGFTMIDGEVGFPGYWALLPVVGTVLIIRFASAEKCLAGRLLSWGPVVYIGKCSYSLYLWHWPVIVLGGALQLRSGEKFNIGWLIAAMAILTLISYHVIEKPTRKAKSILVPVVIGTAISLGIAFFLRVAEFKYDHSVFKATEYYGRLYSVTPAANIKSRGVNLDRDSRSRFEGIKFHDADNQGEYDTGGVIHRFGKETPSVVVFGSSHGMMWGHIITKICKELEVSVSMFNAYGTNPMIQLPLGKKAAPYFTAEQKFNFDSKRLEYLKKWRPKVVIIAHRWSFKYDPMKDVEFLKYIDSCGGQVLFIEQPPELPIGDVSAPKYIAYQHPNMTKAEASRIVMMKAHHQDQLDAVNLRIMELSQFFDYCHFLPVGDFFTTAKNEVLVVDEGKVLYIDDDHLSQAGADKARLRIKNKISQLLELK